MDTVYLGTTDFAATVLERLAASPHRPALVLTRPDRPRGRGRKLAPPPVADRTRELGIELLQPEDVNSPEAGERIARARPAAVCVCAFGALIREPLLSAYEMLNVHPSLLPRWRGAAPVERALEAGDRATGVSIMRPNAELDEGPVFLQRRAAIDPEDDYGSLAARLAELSGELLVETLDTHPEPMPQSADGVTYAAKIERAERRLDPALPADVLARRVRALNPHIGTYLELGEGEQLGVKKAGAAGGSGGAAGELDRDGDRLLLGTGHGALTLLEVQPAGGRPMDALAWWRGHRREVNG
ncbi:MAG: methionyl-tRNA formyltransferase [Thermoleophilaceae bacterium]